MENLSLCSSKQFVFWDSFITSHQSSFKQALWNLWIIKINWTIYLSIKNAIEKEYLSFSQQFFYLFNVTNDIFSNHYQFLFIYIFFFFYYAETADIHAKWIWNPFPSPLSVQLMWKSNPICTQCILCTKRDIPVYSSFFTTTIDPQYYRAMHVYLRK